MWHSHAYGMRKAIEEEKLGNDRVFTRVVLLERYHARTLISKRIIFHKIVNPPTYTFDNRPYRFNKNSLLMKDRFRDEKLWKRFERVWLWRKGLYQTRRRVLCWKSDLQWPEETSGVKLLSWDSQVTIGERVFERMQEKRLRNDREEERWERKGQIEA